MYNESWPICAFHHITGQLYAHDFSMHPALADCMAKLSNWLHVKTSLQLLKGRRIVTIGDTDIISLSNKEQWEQCCTKDCHHIEGVVQIMVQKKRDGLIRNSFVTFE